mmetsp:Transcript_28489/g.32579  ORF Transcript_28489/g.32579 Transcript_28489/m.32579 type:complete len:148 (+) Transcript_28489:215-658(+)
MSKLAASTMCESGYPCPIHGSKQPDFSKIRHQEETESVKANIADEIEEKRSHDFDDISETINEESSASVRQKKSRAPTGAQPPRSDCNYNGNVQNKAPFHPKIISSSFVRKTKKKEVDDIENCWPDRYYYEWRGLPLFVVDQARGFK